MSPSDLVETVIHINRVAKVVKGGRRFSFSALVSVGDQKGNVGIALAKANEVAEAIRKAFEQAKRNMKKVPIENGTLPHEILGQWGAGQRAPASGRARYRRHRRWRGARRARGRGSPDVLTKSLGTNNPINVARATMERPCQARDGGAGGHGARLHGGVAPGDEPWLRRTNSSRASWRSPRSAAAADGRRRTGAPCVPSASSSTSTSVIQNDTPAIRGMIDKVSAHDRRARKSRVISWQSFTI